MRFAVDEQKCTLCGACVSTCPTDMVREKRGAIKISHVACIGCGHCQAICPTGAVTQAEGAGEDPFAPLPEQVARPQALLGLLQTRRTVRRFRPEPVSQDTLRQLLEAARHVPTGANCQCQEFVVLTSPEAITRLRDGILDYYRGYAEAMADREHPERLASYRGGVGAMNEHILAAVPSFVRNMDAGRDRLFFDAPAVIVVHARTDEVLPEAACSFATLAIALMAEALGLGTCITAYASMALEAGLKAAIGIGEANTVYHVVAVGHPVDQYHQVPPRRSPRVAWL